MGRATHLVVATALSSVGSSASAADTASQAVARLYRDYAWEAVVAQPSTPGLAQQPKTVLLKYFTPKLASALAADAACSARNAEICALDFAPLWASQDPAAVDLSVSPGTRAGQVGVQFTYPGTGQVLRLTFRLVRTKAGWRVADIVYPSGPSLAQQLEGSAE
jgi:hypothetical protein